MSRQALDELKRQIRLLEYLQAHDWQPARQLSRGRLMGLCPLHSDHRPSFLVDTSKSLFYCYGCGRGGDVIRFAELYHQVKFPEALALLQQWHSRPPLLHQATDFYRIQLHRHGEAIAYLQRRSPAPPLEFNAGLGFSAALHAADEGRHGEFEHTGSDGSSAGERMQRAGVWAGMLAEEMAAGQDRAEDVVRALIVDEGVPDRGHRKDLMDPFLRRAGVGCASHPVYGVICVIDLASAGPPR